MGNKTDLVVEKAKKYLIRPRDTTHNLAHHDAVWGNCEAIIKNEKLKVNPNLVKVAAYWHDVVLIKEERVSLDNVMENVNFLKNYLPDMGFNQSDVKIILEAIRHHEFRDSPTNIEGMILQDADKLDVLSVDRWNRTMDAFESGEMLKEKYISYARTGLKWITILESTFHFKYSRMVAHESIIKIFDNKRQIEMFNKLSLQEELNESMKSMNSPGTKAKRLLIRISDLKIRFLILVKSLFK